ncbi:cytochrome C biogenesis protein [Halobacillus halophilus]|uniref:AhpC/TSA family protein n=1 Tax=Halobacillus halophilus (strain ATCC 35676 / DSM 2266 / JCM 20832 / KCTC 3685 / LMG 17431 / NBRC 102448 / NCIMB 2269) TaxID=866895 RepID=I0JMX1_HALH3|nr:TlpA disulfide reductase family protein [Halobacillus halophilus]ASF39563.1 cytochrome C biogenesis protein [Halobacillus halophilus]CCG45491.1 AhpC/TSA family protein [Halobacillus halophilus DSM 2266]
MVKQVLASVFLLALLSLVAYNVWSERETSPADSELQTYESNKEEKGAGMTAPNAPSGLKEGEKAPNFKVETLKGEVVQLSDYKGKKVFLNFWATWCPPCRDEMPEMERFQQKYGEEVAVLAVNGTGSETSIDEVRSYIDKGGYSFPILLDKDLELHQTYQTISIPTTYFIGTDGVIQESRKVGPMTYEFMIEMKNALE